MRGEVVDPEAIVFVVVVDVVWSFLSFLAAISAGVSVSVRTKAMDLPSCDQWKDLMPPGRYVRGSASPPVREMSQSCMASASGLGSSVSLAGMSGRVGVEVKW